MMNEITIPYHLAVPTGLCILIILWIIAKRVNLFNGKQKWIWISTTVFFTLYLLIVGSATYNDIYYQWDLNKYDLDADGFFGDQEITEDQKAAMLRLTNDVGRNFSVITGLIFSALISVPLYLIGRLNQRLRSVEK